MPHVSRAIIRWQIFPKSPDVLDKYQTASPTKDTYITAQEADCRGMSLNNSYEADLHLHLHIHIHHPIGSGLQWNEFEQLLRGRRAQLLLYQLPQQDRRCSPAGLPGFCLYSHFYLTFSQRQSVPLNFSSHKMYNSSTNIMYANNQTHKQTRMRML